MFNKIKKKYFNTIIENGYNTNYVIIAICALFLIDTSYCKALLEKYPLCIDFVYVQEFIKHRIIHYLNKGYCINRELLNEFRNYLNSCGWGECEVEYLMQNRNISEFMTFMITKIDPHLITNYIKLDICKNNSKKKLNLTQLFDDWLNDNDLFETDNLDFIIFEIKADDQYESIDVMETIKMKYTNNNFERNFEWKIHALICYDKIKEKYYTLINSQNIHAINLINITNNSDDSDNSYGSIDLNDDSNNEININKMNDKSNCNLNCNFIIINDDEIPSIKEININDINISTKISTEITHIFYRTIY